MYVLAYVTKSLDVATLRLKSFSIALLVIYKLLKFNLEF